MQKKEFHPLVSIIIPVYNGEKYMREAINSALEQTYDNIEVIVVNDGSSDNTEEVAKSYGDKIRYFRKENGGVASAFNYGIQKMKGEYFSWLSHDDFYGDDKVEKEIKKLSELSDKKTVVFSNFALVNNLGEITYQTSFEKKAKLEQINRGVFPVLKGMVNGNSILIHKDIFNDVGLFNENHRTSSDYEMWFNIFKKYNCAFITDVLVYYRIHEEQDTQKSPVYNQESDDLWEYIIKNIDESDIEKIGISKYQLYINLYVQMKNANLKNATKLAYNLAKKNFVNPAISVLMPIYNCEKYVKRAIESVLNQNFGDFELIVINDCTPDKAMNIVNKMAKEDFRIKVFENPKNMGVGVTINEGIKKSTGKYITRLDSDDTSSPDRLLLQYLELENSDYDYCATNINFMDENDNITRYNHYKMPSCPIEFCLAFTNPIPNATIMYSKDIIDKHNLSFCDYRVAEDYDFLTNYCKYGKGTMLKDGLYNYRILSTSLFHDSKKEAIEKSIIISSSYYQTITKMEPNSSYKYLNEFFDNKSSFKKHNVYEMFGDINKIVDSFAEYYKYDENTKYSCTSFLIDRMLTLYNHCVRRSLLAGQNKDNEKLTFISRINNYMLANGRKKTAIKMATYPVAKPIRMLSDKMKDEAVKKKIRVLEVNNIDLPGKVFNGYDMISDLNKKTFDIKQTVVQKLSNNKRVIELLEKKKMDLYNKLIAFEEKNSVHNLFSATSPALINNPYYLNSEIVHFHMFHNTKLSIPSLVRISNEKKVIISLHDPWFLTGRCVHFYNCDKWKNGCNNCKHLDTLFQFKKDNSSIMWNIKKDVFSKSNIDFIVTSEWMRDLLKKSPIFSGVKEDRIHLIPFGINLKRYKNYNNKKRLRKALNISDDEYVIFLRAQTDFKGTEYVLEALKKLNVKRHITVLTCDQSGLLDEVNKKYRIIDLGFIKEKEIIKAFNMCDLFLMPSKAESFGMMAIEAMACEKPVVVFDNSALPSVTFAPECGYLVKDRDSDDLCNAIKYFVENEKEGTERGKIGRELCKKHYSYSEYVKNLEKLYKDIHLNRHITAKTIEYKYSEDYLQKLEYNITEGNNIEVDEEFLDNYECINVINDDLYFQTIGDD